MRGFLKKAAGLILVAMMVGLAVVLMASPAFALFTNGEFDNGFTGWQKSSYRNTLGLNGSPPYDGSDIRRGTATGYDFTYIRGPFGELSQIDAKTRPTTTQPGVLHFPRYGQYCAVINYPGTSYQYNANSLKQQTTTAAGDVQIDGKIHVGFAWAAVVQNPGHTSYQQPYVYVGLKNLTKGTTLYEEFYFAGQVTTPPIWQAAVSSVQFTNWQVKDIAPDILALGIGDTIELEAIAAGCAQGGHWGYLYVDGFAAKAPERLPGADVYPEITDTPDPVTAGQNVTYTIKVSNNGPDPATNVQATDNLPASLTFASTDLAAGTYTVSGQLITCNLGTINNGSFAQFNIVAAVSRTASSPIFNTVSVTNAVADPNTQNNSATASTAVTLNARPAVNAGPDQTLEQTSAQGAQVTLTGSATDDGLYQALNYNWTWAGGSVGGTTATVLLPAGTTTVTLSAYDGQLTGTDTVDITVRDTIAPSITAPANVLKEATSPQTPASIGTATATDVVGVVSITNNALSGYLVGDTNVIWTAKDAAGNSATATQIVTIRDTTAPTIAAPSNITAEMTSPAGTSISLGTPTVSDIADPAPVVTNNAPTVFPKGTTTVTWTVKDASNNSTTATQTVTVRDTTPPAIRAPSNIVAEMTSPAGATVSLGTATVSDIADPAPVLTNDAPSVFAIGTTTVTWTAKDASGNSATAAQTVTVRDTTAPAITAPANIIAEATGPSGTTVNLGTPSVMDLGDPSPQITNSATAPGVDQQQLSTSSTVFWIGSGGGLQVAQKFVPSGSGPLTKAELYLYYGPESTLTVHSDPIVRTGNGFSNSTALAVASIPAVGSEGWYTYNFATPTTLTAGQPYWLVLSSPGLSQLRFGGASGYPDGNIWWSDNVPNPSIDMTFKTYKPVSTTTFPIGTTTVTWTAKDASGNSATATQTVTVHDSIAPVVAPPANVSVEAAGAQTTVSIGSASATDVVGVVLLTSNAPATFPVGTTNVTWTAKDAAGNIGTAIQTVTVRDTIAPDVTPPSNITREATGLTMQIDIGRATATDAVGVVSINSNAPPAFQVAVTNVTWTAVDAAGNTGTATQIITVQDTVAPTLTAPLPVTKEATGTLTTVDLGNGTASDVVGVKSLTNNAPPSFPVGVTTVTWMAKDLSGNTTTATQTVTVIDTIAPVFAPLSPIILEATALMTPYTIPQPTVTDAVGVTSLIGNAPASYPLGVTTITWTAKDAAGNTTTATQTVTVRDTTAPVFSPLSPITLEATAPMTLYTIPQPTVTDAVGLASLTGNAPVVYPVGVTNITWTAKDAAGNTTTATQTVTVRDTTAPAFGPLPTITLEATALMTPYTIALPSVTDAVGVVSVVGNAPANYLVGVTTIVWTAKDAAGNTATANQTVTVRDTTAPIVTPPANITREATGPTMQIDIGTATATDAVGVISLNSNAPATYPIGTSTVTWTAKDLAGNTGTANQIITIRDTTPPVITGAATTLPNTNGWYSQNVTVHFTATDGGAGIKTITPDTLLSNEGANLSVTGTATDNSGNSASTTVGGINIDKSKPVITIIVPAAADYLTNQSILLDFSTTDAVSGVFTKTATLDGNPVNAGQTINLAAMAGSHTLMVSATDKAGNSDTLSRTFNVTVASTIDIDPNTLNLKSQGGGNSFTVYMELPGYDVSQINVSTLKLNVNGVLIPVQLSPTSVGNYDNDQYLDRMVKVDRQQVITALAGKTGNISMTITGQLNDGRKLAGNDTISVTNPGK